MRLRYPHFDSVETRWGDNDVYGHVNNVVYYAYFDSVINRYLIHRGGLDIAHGAVIGLCVESGCSFKKPLAYPAALECGMRVVHLGRSSVKYELAVFARGDEEPAAVGHFVHVFVDRDTRRPTPIPEQLRSAYEAITMKETA